MICLCWVLRRTGTVSWEHKGSGAALAVRRDLLALIKFFFLTGIDGENPSCKVNGGIVIPLFIEIIILLIVSITVAIVAPITVTRILLLSLMFKLIMSRFVRPPATMRGRHLDGV